MKEKRLSIAKNGTRELKSLADLIDESHVCMLENCTKPQALEVLIQCLANTPEVQDLAALREGIFHREELMSTGIGLGIGVPHVRLESIKNPVISVGVCPQGIPDYESLDGNPVNIIFLIAAGKNQHAEHIKLLSLISKKLKDEKLRKSLINAQTPQRVCELLSSGE